MKPLKKGSSRKSNRLTITLAKGQRAEVAAIARDQRTSDATVIRWAIDKYVADSKAKGRERRSGKAR